jgi:hypothetical protein
MRMWMLNPKILCKNHILGQHLELHMFLGVIREGKKLDGYIMNNLLEPLSIESYHNMIVEEMITRGMNHKTPIENASKIITTLPDAYYHKRINRMSAYKTLMDRCPKCDKLDAEFYYETGRMGWEYE